MIRDLASIFAVLLLSGSLIACVTNKSMTLTNKFATCPQQGYQLNTRLILNTDKNVTRSQLYLIRNIGNERVLLDHPSDGQGMGAGWSSELAPQHGSALLLMKSNFILTCAKKIQRDFKATPCHLTLQVCHLAISNIWHDSYWFAENQSLRMLYSKLNHSRVIFT